MPRNVEARIRDSTKWPTILFHARRIYQKNVSHQQISVDCGITSIFWLACSIMSCESRNRLHSEYLVPPCGCKMCLPCHLKQYCERYVHKTREFAVSFAYGAMVCQQKFSFCQPYIGGKFLSGIRFFRSA